jgi:hypothetical protein
MAAPKPCLCGCGRMVKGQRRSRRFYSGACRKRWNRRQNAMPAPTLAQRAVKGVGAVSLDGDVTLTTERREVRCRACGRELTALDGPTEALPLRLWPDRPGSAEIPPLLLRNLPEAMEPPPERYVCAHAGAEGGEGGRSGTSGWGCHANNGETRGPLPSLRPRAHRARWASPVPGLLFGLRRGWRLRLCVTDMRGLTGRADNAFPLIPRE